MKEQRSLRPINCSLEGGYVGSSQAKGREPWPQLNQQPGKGLKPLRWHKQQEQLENFATRKVQGVYSS